MQNGMLRALRTRGQSRFCVKHEKPQPGVTRLQKPGGVGSNLFRRKRIAKKWIVLLHVF